MPGTRVLFVAYHFPPTGGSGVQRSSKFVRYLPEHGFDPIVVTGPGEAGGRWSPSDRSVADDIGDDVEVIRARGPVPGDPNGLGRRAKRFLRARTPFDKWWTDAVGAAGCTTRGVSLVFASMPPYSSAFGARHLAAGLGVPWIADLRDPWALDEYSAFPTLVHRALERHAMRAALASAAAVLLPTPGMVADVVGAFPELRGRTFHIPNGFDPADFASPPPLRTEGTFRIVHAGYFYADIGRRRLRLLLRGTDLDVDLYPRSPAFLLDALDRLFEARPELRTGIRLQLAGPLSPVDEQILARARCRDVVEAHGYLPHAESVELIRSADALFLPMHRAPPGARSGIIPGKLYEYLASGRPILAAVPEGDARDLLERAEWTVVCDPDDAGAITTALLSLLEAMPSRRVITADREELLARFERPRLTAELARIFDLVLKTQTSAKQAQQLEVIPG